MSIKKTISGIRGTIGGRPGDNLTPIDVVECTAGFGQWIIRTGKKREVIVGRDGRISGPIVSSLAIDTLLSMGIDVIDLGPSTTPTVEMAVIHLEAGAGIIFTASHNARQWNALKFLNDKGEFISATDGKNILKFIEEGDLDFCQIDELGRCEHLDGMIDMHIEKILSLPYIDTQKIKSKKFHVIVDCINSTGAISIPPLLDRLGCSYSLINQEMNGEFAHNPEPLPAHLQSLSNAVKESKADLGIAVDPDVDRLAFVSENGEIFGEEYTIVAAADFILGKKKGNTVSNLSSSRALSDITRRHGGEYSASAVGEVNVVDEMKRTHAVIGGEGNGGVILPDLHYGRDALAGIALVLNLLAERDISLSQLRESYPAYEIRKHKIDIDDIGDLDMVVAKLKEKYSQEAVTTIDGVKIDFAHGWVHLRASNTEPILRIYSESKDGATADQLATMIKKDLRELT